MLLGVQVDFRLAESSSGTTLVLVALVAHFKNKLGN